jgi:hypothetical protein
MTRRRIFLKSRKNSLCAVLTFCIALTAMLLAVGCVGQPGDDKNVSGNLTLQNPGIVPLHTTLTQDPSATAMPDLTIDNIRRILVSWNEKMHWNLSPVQIEEYSLSMENGVLKKYRTNPMLPYTLYIPDRDRFYYETGIALGFTTEESKEFVWALDEYRREEWAMSDCRDYVNNKPCPQRTIAINFTAQPRPLSTP